MTLPRAYTVAQVASLWGVSDTFIYDLCHSGQLPGAFKLGRKLWRIPPAALDLYEQEAAAAGETPEPEHAGSAASPPDASTIGRLTRRAANPRALAGA